MQSSRSFMAPVAFVFGLFLSGPGSASPVPAEFPPVSFTGSQYIDSTGCAFIRVGGAGLSDWVQRIDRQRRQICGLTPTKVGRGVSQVHNAPNPLAGLPNVSEVGAVSKAPLRSVASAALLSATVPQINKTPRMTRAQVCAKMRARGVVYTNAATGKPVLCGPSTLTEMPYLPQNAPVSAHVQQSPQLNRALYKSKVQDGGDLADGLFSQKIFSNASVETLSRIIHPKGYRSAWDDGRLNAQRGLRGAGNISSSTQVLRASAEPVLSVPSRGRYVQIGSYRQLANVKNNMRRMQALGLPAESVASGRGLQAVLVGPFASSSQLSAALSTVRRSGFRDAFTR